MLHSVHMLSTITLRPPRPGDLGWIIHRHGAIYAEEYGWDWRFEGLVAEICAQFITNFDPAKERCWIAERDGKIVGSIFLAKESDSTAKLRLLYVEAETRGTGLGTRLIEECLSFARESGYERVTLWTNSILTTARRLYEKAGFRLVREESYENFGKQHVTQVWELKLTD